MESIDAVSVRIQADKNSNAFAGLVLGEHLIYVQPGRGALTIGHWEGRKWVFDLSKPCEQRASYVLAVAVESGRLVVYLDGREAGRIPAPAPALERIGLYVFDGEAAFDQIRVRAAR